MRVKIGALEAGLRGNVAELPPAQVFVQPARLAADRAVFFSCVIAAAGQKNVHQPVAVEVKHGGAAPERFENAKMSRFLTDPKEMLYAGVARLDHLKDRRRSGLLYGFGGRANVSPAARSKDGKCGHQQAACQPADSAS